MLKFFVFVFFANSATHIGPNNNSSDLTKNKPEILSASKAFVKFYNT